MTSPGVTEVVACGPELVGAGTGHTQVGAQLGKAGYGEQRGQTLVIEVEVVEKSGCIECAVLGESVKPETIPSQSELIRGLGQLMQVVVTEILVLPTNIGSVARIIRCGRNRASLCLIYALKVMPEAHHVTVRHTPVNSSEKITRVGTVCRSARERTVVWKMVESDSGRNGKGVAVCHRI
jgi:hypothetical protein